MMEIYNEQIRDLLPRPTAAGDSTAGPRKVLARMVDPSRAAASEHPSHGGVLLEGLAEQAVREPREVMRAVLHGLEQRASSKTDMNERSSRSHLVVRVRARLTASLAGEPDGTDGSDAPPAEFREGVLTLVDLAGSERLARSGAVGSARKEAQHINQSLSTLGSVLAALQRKSPHVPFRDSALTSLLSPCLTPGSGGRAVLFAHVSPVSADAQESTCTLEFAVRAAKVQLGRAVAKRQQGAGPSGADAGAGATRAKQDLLRARTQLAREKARCQDRDKEIEKLRKEVARQR